jgi:hypothetical protein
VRFRHRANACTWKQRKRHDRDFPQLDLVELADARLRTARTNAIRLP